MVVDEQEKQDRFEELVGSVQRATRIQAIWNNSYPHGTEYDKTFKTGHYRSKEDDFKRKAKSAGFTDREITAFLNL